MPQAPTDPHVAQFLASRLSWSAHHVENATSVLNRFAAWLASQHPETALIDVSRAQCQAYMAHRASALGRGGKALSATTLHKEHQVLCWLYGWLAAEGELPLVARRMGRDTVWVEGPPLGPMSGVAAPAQGDPDPDRTRAIGEADYRRLMASFDRRRRIDCRNAAICSLMYWSGVRRSEVTRADVANYDALTGTLNVCGKGRKWRQVVLLEETRQLLDRYLRRRHDDPADALFASSMKGHDALATGRLRPDAVSAFIEGRCARLGIKVSAHEFRRAATISAKRRGIPETEIARQHGWAPQSAKLMIPRYTAADANALVAEAYRATDPTAPRGRARRLRSA